MRRALNSSDWINTEDWEVKQNEWTRTRLSLDRMQAEVNKVSGGRESTVMLLCGADILDSMVTPGGSTDSIPNIFVCRYVVHTTYV